MTICHPDTAIWPDASVTLPSTGATPGEVALHRVQVDLALGYGWSTLQVLTAYQISICPITVRPCGSGGGARGSYYIAPIDGPNGGSPWWPSLVDGMMINVMLRDGSSQEWVDEIVLPGPVGKVQSVIIDGVVLDPEMYRVDNGNRLVREDGQGWPSHQDFNLPAGSVGTFTVTYYHGATADTLVRYAAGTLAAEYLKAIKGDDDCALPAGTTQVVRQGITIELDRDMFENGMTGIRLVDDVTARFNPFRQKLPAQVFSLDRQPARQTTIPPYRIS